MPSLSEVLISSFVPRGTTSIYFTHTFLVPRGTKGGGTLFILCPFHCSTWNKRTHRYQDRL